VSPRTASPGTRDQLIEVAARILAEEGPRGLSVRRAAAEIGTSTMAIYTQFGSMEELRRAVRVEGFRRLAENMASVPPLRDPVAEIAALGFAYCLTAVHNPNLYRTLFYEAPLDDAVAAAGAPSFERLVAAVDRAIASERFRPADSSIVARRFWAMTHGVITLEIAGLLARDDAVADLLAMAAHLCAGCGDDPRVAARSVLRGHRTMERLTAEVAGRLAEPASIRPAGE
jgi:AcrR family transcriptional regulator